MHLKCQCDTCRMRLTHWWCDVLLDSVQAGKIKPAVDATIDIQGLRYHLGRDCRKMHLAMLYVLATVLYISVHVRQPTIKHCNSVLYWDSCRASQYKAL